MPSITIRFENEDQLNQLKSEAMNANQTINAYILFKLFNVKVDESILTLNDVIERALKVESGKEFTIPSLYPYDVWTELNPAYKKSTGRAFFKAVDKTDGQKGPYSEEFEFKGKSSNVAVYKRR